MKAFTLTLAMMMLAITTIAQGPGPGMPGGDPDEPVPIDGGMYVLMAAGIFYGLKTLKRRDP